MDSGHITRDVQFLKTKKLVAILSIALIVVSGLSVVEFYALNDNKVTHFSFGTQHMAVYINGKLIAEKLDSINGLAYDLLVCKAFNDTTACAQLSQAGGVGYGGTPAWTGGASDQNCKANSMLGSATSQNGWKSATYCSVIAVGLSSNTAAISGGGSGSQLYCPSQISGNGFNAVKAVTSHTAGTNSVVLTASWTAGGSPQTNIGTACLFPYNDVDGHTGLVSGVGIPSVGFPPILIDLLPNAPISVNSGAAFTLTWTITF